MRRFCDWSKVQNDNFLVESSGWSTVDAMGSSEPCIAMNQRKGKDNESEIGRN
jgi:hypothetical protein